MFTDFRPSEGDAEEDEEGGGLLWRKEVDSPADLAEGEEAVALLAGLEL